MTNARQLQRPATYQDVLDAPQHLVAEILNGELVLSPRPAYLHSRATTRLSRRLGPFDEPDEGEPSWVILVEPEIHLGGTVVVPDLAGWRRERMPEVIDAHFTELVPDWLCEVASPSTRRADRMIKMPLYREHGAEWVWLVDPRDELIEVFKSDGPSWRLEAQAVGAGAVRLPPFEAIEIDPADLFAR